MGDAKSLIGSCFIWIIALLICFKTCGYIDGCIKSLSTPITTLNAIPKKYQGTYKQVSTAIENGDEEPYYLKITEKETSIINPVDDYTRVEIITKIDLYQNWIKMHFHSKTIDEDREFLLILKEGVYIFNEEINGETLSEHGHFIKIK